MNKEIEVIVKKYESAKKDCDFTIMGSKLKNLSKKELEALLWHSFKNK